ARRKIHDVHARAPTYITTEALQRIGELYAIEAEVRGCSAEQRLAARKARAAPLMQSLYDWIQQQMKTLSRHSDTAKAFAYLLKQWDALNVYCSNGWVEIDNNIAENALRGVAVGRKNWMFAGSDSGGEHAAVLYSLIGTCRLNNVEPEKWLRYVIEHIQDWPANRVGEIMSATAEPAFINPLAIPTYFGVISIGTARIGPMVSSSASNVVNCETKQRTQFECIYFSQYWAKGDVIANRAPIGQWEPYSEESLLGIIVTSVCRIKVAMLKPEPPRDPHIPLMGDFN
ncbi:IS66 family transposase, partial [Escherichia coli]